MTTTSTKWRVHFSANNTTATNGVGFADLELRTAVGVARPFVQASISASITHTGTASITGTAGLTALTMGAGTDDAVYAISLPFPIDYGGGTTSTVWVSTNSYVCFVDPGGDYHSGFSGSTPPRPNLQIGAQDGKANSIYYGSLDGNATFRICFDGNSDYRGTGTSEIWELTFTAATPETWRLDCGSGPASGGRAIGDGINATYIATLASGVNNTGYDIVMSGTPAEAVATASSFHTPIGANNLLPANGIDGLYYTEWMSAGGGAGPLDEWFQVELSSPFTCVEYVFTILAWDVYTPMAYIPTAWTLEAWNGSSWDVVDTRSGEDMRAIGVNAQWPFTVGVVPVPTYGDITFLPIERPLDPYGDITFPAYTMPFPTYGDITLPTLILGNDGADNIGALSWPKPTVAATGFQHQMSAGEGFFPELEVAGSLEPALALPTLGLAAIGKTGNVADAALALPPWALAGGIDDVRALPAWTLAAVGQAGILVTGALTLPQFTLSGALDQALPLPTWTLAGVLLAGNDAAGAISFAAPTAAGSFGTMAEIDLPLFALAAAGLTGSAGAAAVTLPALTLGATLYAAIHADGDLTLARYTLAAAMSGYQDGATVAAATITLPQLSLAARAGTGNTATASLTLPLYAVDAASYSSAIGYAHIELPAFQLAATATTSGAALPNAAAARSCVVLNPRVSAVTLYQGIGANSFANFAGVTLAATDDGIVALVGETDQGVPIAAHVLGGITDFGDQKMKRVLSGYVGYRAGGDMELTLITDQHHEFIYRLLPRQDSIRIHASRVKFGRGVDGRYWQWRLANLAGAKFELDGLRLAIDSLSRGV